MTTVDRKERRRASSNSTVTATTRIATRITWCLILNASPPQSGLSLLTETDGLGRYVREGKTLSEFPTNPMRSFTLSGEEEGNRVSNHFSYMLKDSKKYSSVMFTSQLISLLPQGSIHVICTLFNHVERE